MNRWQEEMKEYYDYDNYGDGHGDLEDPWGEDNWPDGEEEDSDGSEGGLFTDIFAWLRSLSIPSWTYSWMGSLIPDFSWITGTYSVGFWMFTSFFGLTFLFTMLMFCSYKAILDLLNTATCGLFSYVRSAFKCLCACIF